MYDLVPRDNDNGSTLKKGGIVVLLVIAIIALLMASITKMNASYADTKAPKSSSPLSVFRAPKAYLAAIHIEGVIESKNQTYDQAWLLDTISDLASDRYNIGIFLVINSPGGGVYEADAVYLALMDYKEQTGRPVYTYMQSLAASGGYYIACASDKIFANRNTLTGSIGVIAGASLDISELLAKYGIKYTTITAGKNKNMGGLNSPLTDEQRAIMQSLADECYEQFTGIVAQRRNMELERVKAIADGRIYSASQALNNGLIDGVVRWGEAIDAFDSDTGHADTNYEIVDYRPTVTKKFMDYLLDARALFSPLSAKNSIIPEAVLSRIPEISGPAYLYTAN